MNERAAVRTYFDWHTRGVPLYGAAFTDQLAQLRKERGWGDPVDVSCDTVSVSRIGNQVATLAHDNSLCACFALPVGHDNRQLVVASGHVGKSQPTRVDLVAKEKAPTATYEEGNNQDTRHRFLPSQSFLIQENHRKIGRSRLWDSAQVAQKGSDR